MHDSGSKRPKRVLYAKGGRAIAEAKRLFPLAGQTPSLGPDQFLLSALYATPHAYFRLATLGPKNQSQKFKNAEAVEYGLRPDSNSRISGLLQQVNGLIRFFVSTLFWRPTLILGGVEGPMAMASLFAAKILGAKFVFLVHTDVASPWLSQRKRALNGYVIQNADAVIVHGPFLRDRALELRCQPSRLFVFDTGFIPNQGGEEASRSQTAPVDADTFFYAGRIEVDKGVFDLLKAFEDIADLYRAKLVIAGDGSEVERLRVAAAASKHSDKISVTGPIPHSELMHRMRCSIAVVTPTQAIFPEGRCMSAMESLLVGTPVIAPDFGAFPYLVKHETNGLLYQPDSVSALTQAMAAIATDPELMARLRMGAKQSGQTLMQPERTFLQCLIEATR